MIFAFVERLRFRRYCLLWKIVSPKIKSIYSSFCKFVFVLVFFAKEGLIRYIMLMVVGLSVCQCVIVFVTFYIYLLLFFSKRNRLPKHYLTPDNHKQRLSSVCCYSWAWINDFQTNRKTFSNTSSAPLTISHYTYAHI